MPIDNNSAGQAIRGDGGAHLHDITQVAGDLFQLFVAAPPALRDRIRVREFRTLITERVRTFVGRQFVKSAVSELLNSPLFPSGYIVIRGQPGIGKTALMCALVNEGGYLHHFNIAPQNIRSSRTFLENICAQLIVRYKLDYVVLPPSAGLDSSVLSQLLDEAVEKAGERITIFVDALDEAGEDSPQSNTLLLPPTLPDGVHFVVSTRLRSDDRLAVDRRKDLYLRDDDPANLEDVRLYIETFLHNFAALMTPKLVGWGLDEVRFIAQMAGRSQGNFMYLVHVLADIRDGLLAPDTIGEIQNLPLGLQAYYQRHWRAMRDVEPERFESIYEPVLRMLATVREPVSSKYVAEVTGLDRTRVREVVNAWVEFLNVNREMDDERYRVYHLSFQEFLAAEGEGLLPSHSRIVRLATNKIPGFGALSQ